ncbi:MAG: glycosyltransferase [Alphaproteobacteria bacterium]|nr:glycosyltransferase [Alphaproteobacteria bacterium]
MNSSLKNLAGHFFYILVLAAFTISLPASLWDPASRDFILLIGVIAIWRYSWWGINLTRFLIYTKLVFPKWRYRAEKSGKDLLPSHVYLLLTSFRIGTETTRKVYGSAIEEAMAFHRKHNIPVTLLASIVEKSDEILIKKLYEEFDVPNTIKLVIIRIAGTGKRDALAYGFRAIAKENPPADGIAAVIDGDSLLEKDLIEKCTSLFKIHKNLGAITTDEICDVEGNWIFKQWYSMRFAQRHIYMSSVSLSKRVLTLTGRMSMFRTDILTNPEFIERVEMDWIDHWRLGRFKFLTGDDKSSWYHILKSGYKMLYVPDVSVLTIETPPDPSFIKSSVVLMRRWFGNMLRTNGRAIKLGPQKCNLFPWISIIDQRLSMWTSLTGLSVTILATFTITPYAFIFYLYWMMLTRYIIVLTFLTARPSVSALYPFFLYYNQIVGSFVKTYVLFRLDKQKWTRQNTIIKSNKGKKEQFLTNVGSFYMHLFSFLLFIVALASMSGILKSPDFNFWFNFFSEQFL